MCKWLIGLGGVVLLLVLWGAQPVKRGRPPDCEPPSVSLLSWVTGDGQDVWGAWVRLPPRRGCDRNPARRRRVSKKARQRFRHWRPGLRDHSDGQAPAAPPVEAQPEGAHTSLPAAGASETSPAGETSAAVSLHRRRGRPADIPTNHVFCPSETCRGCRQLGPHPEHRIVGDGTYETRSGQRQLYRCEWCQTRFSETQGSVFFGLKTPQETVYRALACVAEGLGIRATARVLGVKPEDVLRWLRRAGQHTELVSAYLMRNLHVEQIQLDELWTFVRKKEKTLSAWEALHTEWGDTWIWTAVDPASKLVLAFLVGEHTETEAVGIVGRLKAVLAEGCLPLFTSDQLPHYIQALLQVFGRWVQSVRNGTRGRFPHPRLEPPDDLQYATVHKERQGGRVVSVTTQVVFGRAEELLAHLVSLGMRQINTSFVERMNLTLRHLVSRLKRRGLNFSKKREYLVWHLQLAIGYYHLVRPHRGLRLHLAEPIPTRGTPKKWEQRTPAMAAGLTDHIWTLEELLMFHVPPGAA